jgi:hypothetical protein
MIPSDDPDQSLPLLLEQVTASLTGKSKQALLLLPVASGPESHSC